MCPSVIGVAVSFSGVPHFEAGPSLLFIVSISRVERQACEPIKQVGMQNYCTFAVFMSDEFKSFDRGVNGIFADARCCAGFRRGVGHSLDRRGNALRSGHWRHVQFSGHRGHRNAGFRRSRQEKAAFVKSKDLGAAVANASRHFVPSGTAAANRAGRKSAIRPNWINLMAANRFSGQARREARCLSIGRASQRTRGVDLSHRRPGSFAPWRRCASLPVSRIWKPSHRHAKRAWPRRKIIPVKWLNLVG